MGENAKSILLAKKLYDKYCDAVGGKAFNGDDLPNSDEFFADISKQEQAIAWVAVAQLALEEVN